MKLPSHIFVIHPSYCIDSQDRFPRIISDIKDANLENKTIGVQIPAVLPYIEHYEFEPTHTMIDRIVSALSSCDYNLLALENQELWDRSAALGIVSKLAYGEMNNIDFYRMASRASLNSDLVSASKAHTGEVAEAKMYRKWQEIVRTAGDYRQQKLSRTCISAHINNYARMRWQHIDSCIAQERVDALILTPEHVKLVIERYPKRDLRIYQ